MKLEDFDYFLPPQAIAQKPADRRDESRLLRMDRRNGSLSHHLFRDLPDLLQPGDLLVMNESRVLPARLHAHRRPGGGILEILLLEEEPIGSKEWNALLRPVRKTKIGDRFTLPGEEGNFELLEKKEYGLCRVRAHFPDSVLDLMSRHGETPLPPYIKRQKTDVADLERYQTVYARTPGSVAAPTAGLHFTPEVFHALTRRGVETCRLTLHVGPATFLPIRTEEIEKHRLPTERVIIPEETALAIQKAKGAGRRILAVGTTSTRALESSAAHHQGEVAAGETRADLYIHPPYRFQVIDGLITNFHLPQSSLLILVSAFAGRDHIRKGYEEAVDKGYRFYSYGDCMVIL